MLIVDLVSILEKMVNALFSSKPGGTKQFKRVKEAEFGWKAITDLYNEQQ